MKNVYHDYKLENDNVESVDDINPLPQFKPENTPKKRRVEYDKNGNVRKDKSMSIFKILGLIVAVILVNLYAFHTCGSQLGNLF